MSVVIFRFLSPGACASVLALAGSLLLLASPAEAEPLTDHVWFDPQWIQQPLAQDPAFVELASAEGPHSSGLEGPPSLELSPALGFEAQALQGSGVATSADEPLELDSTQPTDSERIDKLEAELEKLQSAAEKPEEEYPADPTANFAMELQADAYTFGQDEASFDTVGNIPEGTAFRRARVGWFGDWELTQYRIEFDFALSGRPSFLDSAGSKPGPRRPFLRAVQPGADDV
jgi:hypothetical protein